MMRIQIKMRKPWRTKPSTRISRKSSCKENILYMLMMRIEV
uniref:Uncharacterized protein n=1 Tax=Arundo donax TaxID=35708 RepID=A0A0A8YTS5_ARUDO